MWPEQHLADLASVPDSVRQDPSGTPILECSSLHYNQGCTSYDSQSQRSLARSNEAISIRAIESPALSDERKQELAEQLKKYFAEVDALRKPDSQEDAEDIINEAMKSVRPGYRPHQ